MRTAPEAAHPPVPRSLVTIAFLKARFDERADHLDMFIPLVSDAVCAAGGTTFTAADIQRLLADRHGLAMPQHTVATLLNRSVHRKALTREYGRYKATTQRHATIDIRIEQARIEGAQRSLASALRGHAATRGLRIDTDERALELILEFVEQQQVGLLLNGPAGLGSDGASSRELIVVAEFVRNAIEHQADLAATIRDILEGLVLYRAAFLPDIAQTKKHFANLRVYFDSGIVRQALGYEGVGLQSLARETLDVLKAAGIQTLAFDKTISEIRRILAMYENKLATSAGQRSLRPSEMARHFLNQHYTPSDVAQMNALLEREISAAGFQIQPTPERQPQHTGDEKALAMRLAGPEAHDEDSPRVTHDVDCVAAVLTIRHGHKPEKLEDAKAIFVSSASLVVKNVMRWFAEQGESGTPPIVHVRALSNLAWLKRPAVVIDFKLREMVALCSAALRPSKQTWERFLRHLDALRRTNSITSDEAAAIVVSDLADRLLSEAELTDGETGPDAQALDEVVEKVKASYAADAAKRIAAIEAERDATLAAVRDERDVALAAARDKEATLVKDATSAAEKLREMEMRVEARARGIARPLSQTMRWCIVLLVLGGAVAVALTHIAHGGWVGILTGAAVTVFVVLEVVGILGHLSALTLQLESWLTRRVRQLLVPEREENSRGLFSADRGHE